MALVTITDQDRRAAATFLEQYLQEAVPTGDFSRGSFLYDVVISALSYTVAFLRQEAALVSSKQSISGVLAMASGEERDSAADALLSNWFLTRRTGIPSRGLLRVYLTQSVSEVIVPKGAQFTYSSDKIFVLDSDTNVVITGATDLLFDYSSGVPTYYFTVPVRSVDTGVAYDVTPRKWSSWDRFSPYIAYVESTDAFSGGASVETTEQFLARAKDSLSTRDLNSQRSIRAVLRDTFAAVEDVLVVGAGDPELRRDLISVVGNTLVHSGGYVDVYLRGTVVEKTFTGLVGGSYTDPRPSVLNFYAGEGTDLSWVVPGHVLKIYNALSGEPTEYVVAETHNNYLSVSERNPFPEIRADVQYSLGSYAPSYMDIVPGVGQPIPADGVFSKAIKLFNTVVLPAGPIYRIKEVSIYDPNISTWVELTREPLLKPTDGLPLNSYRLSYLDAQTAESAHAVPLLYVNYEQVGSEGSVNSDGLQLKVRYDTLDSFDLVHAYLTNDSNRIVCANILAKGLHPVYLNFTSGTANGLVYTVKPTAARIPTPDEIKLALADFINTFPTGDELNASDVTTFLYTQFPELGGIPRFDINYDLLSPDGRVISYSTSAAASVSSGQVDQVKLAPSHEVGTVKLPDPLVYGISSRTVRYLTSPDLLNVIYGG